MGSRRHRLVRQFLSSPACKALAVLLAVGIILLPFGCGGQARTRAPAPAGTPMVRVLLFDNRQQISLSATQPPLLRTAAGQQIRLSAGEGATVSLTPSGWMIGELSLPPGELRIEPAAEGSVAFEGKAYRGAYRLTPRPNGKFDVINDIDVDGYLMGVLADELLKPWHPEAYRAQAIVARTYALYVARTAPAAANFDLFADTRSQVYNGIRAETAKSRDAVEATRGMVVASGPPGQERIFKAYFSSCCGGVTQSSAAAFGDAAEPALSEQNFGQRCAASPKFNWPTMTIPKSELSRRIRLWGVRNNAPESNIGDVARVEIFSTNAFGRPASFAITDTRGFRYRLCSEDFRIAANTDASGGPRLPSSFCKPINQPGVVEFTEGHGLGHGVGMCQWCAQIEATNGATGEQIVKDAYPHSVLVKAY